MKKASDPFLEHLLQPALVATALVSATCFFYFLEEWRMAGESAFASTHYRFSNESARWEYRQHMGISAIIFILLAALKIVALYWKRRLISLLLFLIALFVFSASLVYGHFPL